MVTRVRNTGRSSNAVPAYAPFNFGINQVWYEEFKNKDTHRVLLEHGRWYTYEDPPGFGTAGIETHEEDSHGLDGSEVTAGTG